MGSFLIGISPYGTETVIRWLFCSWKLVNSKFATKITKKTWGGHRRFHKTATNMNTLVHYLEGNAMINERIESLPCDGAWPPYVQQFFLLTHAGKMEKSTSQQHIPIFSAELSRMKRSFVMLSRVTRAIDFKAASSSAVYKFEWFSQQSTLTFLYPYFMMRKLKYSRMDRNPFPNLINMQLLRLRQIPLESVLEVLFIFNMIYVINLFSN